MKIRDPQMRSALAGEYVVGTLIGRARKRFETLLENDPMLRGEVEGWQIQLYQLVDFLPEQTPPDEVWEKLSTRIIPRRNRSSGIWQSLTFWRSVSVLAACAILLVIGLGIDREVAAPSDHHIVVADQQQRAVWLIHYRTDTANVDSQNLERANTEYRSKFRTVVDRLC